jgi:hypothetical protein
MRVEAGTPNASAACGGKRREDRDKTIRIPKGFEPFWDRAVEIIND